MPLLEAKRCWMLDKEKIFIITSSIPARFRVPEFGNSPEGEADGGQVETEKKNPNYPVNPVGQNEHIDCIFYS